MAIAPIRAEGNACGPPPSAALSGQYAIRSGETANLQLTSSLKGSYFFTLSDRTEYLGQSLVTPVPKSPTVSTTYTLASFGTQCGSSPNLSGLARIDVTNLRHRGRQRHAFGGGLEHARRLELRQHSHGLGRGAHWSAAYGRVARQLYGHGEERGVAGECAVQCECLAEGGAGVS